MSKLQAFWQSAPWPLRRCAVVNQQNFSIWALMSSRRAADRCIVEYARIIMKPLFFVLLVLALAAGAPSCARRSNTVDLFIGTIDLPNGFTHTRGDGYDSICGHFTSPDGMLVIQYDIGPLAGVYAENPSDEPEVSSADFKAGELTWLLSVRGPTTPRLTIISFPMIGPTNFYAYVRNENDVKMLKEVAAHFKPKARKAIPKREIF